VEEAISFINARPKPLALYAFTYDKGVQEKIKTRTSSGCISPLSLYLDLLLVGHFDESHDDDELSVDVQRDGDAVLEQQHPVRWRGRVRCAFPRFPSRRVN